MTQVSPGALGVAFDDSELEKSVRAGLEAAERLLREKVGSSDAFLDVTGRHLVDAGGKRFRPLVTMLAAQFGDPTRSEVAAAAVVCEITHLATLYHDAVMDE